FAKNICGNGGAGLWTAGGGRGGSVYNADWLIVTNCTFHANTGGKGGDGYVSGFGTAGGAGGNGGAIFNAKAFWLVACTFSGNIGGDGGNGRRGVYSGCGPGGVGGIGGAVYNATSSSSAALRSVICALNFTGQ